MPVERLKAVEFKIKLDAKILKSLKEIDFQFRRLEEDIPKFEKENPAESSFRFMRVNIANITRCLDGVYKEILAEENYDKHKANWIQSDPNQFRAFEQQYVGTETKLNQKIIGRLESIARSTDKMLQLGGQVSGKPKITKYGRSSGLQSERIWKRTGEGVATIQNEIFEIFDLVKHEFSLE